MAFVGDLSRSFLLLLGKISSLFSYLMSTGLDDAVAAAGIGIVFDPENADPYLLNVYLYVGSQWGPFCRKELEQK